MQLQVPEPFLAANEGPLAPERVMKDAIRLTGGRVLECSTRSLHLGDQIVGRWWIRLSADALAALADLGRRLSLCACRRCLRSLAVASHYHNPST